MSLNYALEARVADGRFRDDLFHRLNVIHIHVPALRERPEDIPLLAASRLVRTRADVFAVDGGRE